MESKTSKDAPTLLQDPDFCKGTGTFNFTNGDQYEGDYCAHRSGVVWREGIGTYTSNDGQIYKGEWKDDKLMDDKQIEVTYPSGVQFNGYIVKNKYEGPGMYILENKMTLLCDFSQNKPIGELSLIDIKGRQWHGVAAQDETLLVPEHIYFNNIHDNAGKGRRRSQPSKPRQSTSTETSLLLSTTSKSKSTQSKLSHVKQAKFDLKKDQLMKEKLFAKTKKTISDLQFESSDWYQNYVNFKSVYDNIRDKIKNGGEASLGEDEKKWYEKYMRFKQRYSEIMSVRKNKNLSQQKLFELIDVQAEFNAKCPPVPVIYPTGDCDSVCECDVSENNGSKHSK